ncbi:MAG: glyoxalase [Thermoleophilia bacterium]|nr:glyoxalase [Thermoleophilia bacterium]
MDPVGHVIALDHLQVCCPRGGEERARAFYCGLLGLPEVEKPAELAARGGCWFRIGDVGLHVGVLEPFVPATKAHPAFRITDRTALDTLVLSLAAAGHAVEWADVPIAEARCKVTDPFGNLVELLVGTTG